jgi:thioredoxin 1
MLHLCCIIGSMPISTVIHTNEQSIDRVLGTGLPVLLVFWRRTSPVPSEVDATLGRLAEQYAGRALFAKIDADDQQNLLARFEVASGLPAALLVRKGEPLVTLAGDDLRNGEAWLAHAVEGKPRPELQSVDATGEGRAAFPVTLTDANFQQAVGGPGPVLVDFWAAWCGPCRTIAPHVAQLARDFAGRATVAKLNIDENPQTTQRYKIMSIPALFIFKNGAVVEEIIGVQPLAVLQQKLTRHVG